MICGFNLINLASYQIPWTWSVDIMGAELWDVMVHTPIGEHALHGKDIGGVSLPRSRTLWFTELLLHICNVNRGNNLPICKVKLINLWLGSMQYFCVMEVLLLGDNIAYTMPIPKHNNDHDDSIHIEKKLIVDIVYLEDGYSVRGIIYLDTTYW